MPMSDLSVVIPTYNRRDALTRTIAGLFERTVFDGKFEAIVVDDGSRDGTTSAVTYLAEECGYPIRALSQPNRGAAAARNAGARAATSPIVAFMDDDIEVDPGFIAGHHRAITDHPDALVTGRIEYPAATRATPFGRWRYSLQQTWNGPVTDGPRPTEGVTAQSLSIRLSHFHALGGFDERFLRASCEDWELSHRARLSGLQVLYDPRILGTHLDWVATVEDFCERQRLYAIGHVQAYLMYGSTSPYAATVEVDRPAAGNHHLLLEMRKNLKAALATRIGREIIGLWCTVGDWFLPDKRFTTRGYEAAVAIATYQGVREGLRAVALSAAASK